MNKRPRILDLFCGAGGAGYGYYLAGFEVIGADIVFQSSYPFEFHQDDAFHVLETLINGGTWCGYTLSDFAAIHASPNCQRYSHMLNFEESYKDNHPDFIAPIRELLQATGKPYIIENVKGARKEMPDAIMLCGCMFPGLRVKRERLFESNCLLIEPPHNKTWCRKHKVAKASRIPRGDEWWSPVGCTGQKDKAQRAMGITWMKTTGSRDREISQAIPPAFTEYVGNQIINLCLSEEVA